MSVTGVNSVTQTYAPYTGSTKTAGSTTETKKNTAASEGVVYENGSSDNKKAAYSINKMSAEDRAAIVKDMQEKQAARQNQLVDIVNKMLTGQAKKFTKADDSFWNMLSKGGLTVDAAAKKEAQEAISEDGYYGVKQTAQRIFDFASALAGDDVEKMEEMQKAFEKGYKQATKSWGRDLPDISSQTRDKVNSLFEEYYDSKGKITE